jgi:hypothetical protein
MGMIGFTVNGVAFYNALDDAGHDVAMRCKIFATGIHKAKGNILTTTAVRHRIAIHYPSLWEATPTGTPA